MKDKDTAATAAGDDTFVKFPKIARYSREVIVTEKIDGTNAQIIIGEDGTLSAGSRNRLITPGDDNHGFARWVQEHREELLTLGPGRHFGEWWGSGIQRGYGLPPGVKRFSLFNVVRWCLHGNKPLQIPTEDPRVVKYQEVLPPCVGLVPVIWTGMFDYLDLSTLIANLATHGSQAAPGFMNPEGLVVYHTAGRVMFKKTIHGDGTPKSLAEPNPVPADTRPVREETRCGSERECRCASGEMDMPGATATGTLSFSLPECSPEFKTAVHAPDLASALFDIDQDMRGHLKHGSSRTADRLAEDVRDIARPALDLCGW